MRLSTILAELDDDPTADLQLGAVLDATHHAGFGFLIAFLAILSCSVPGVGVPFGLAIALLGMQIAAGYEQPWLPKRLRRHVVSWRTRRWLAEKLARGTGWVEKVIYPRWPFFFRREIWPLCGLGLLVQGVGLALPLPIPGSNLMFAAPIAAYAFGLLEDDGCLLAIGHAATVLNILLSLLLWDAFVRAFQSVTGFVGGLFS